MPKRWQARSPRGEPLRRGRLTSVSGEATGLRVLTRTCSNTSVMIRRERSANTRSRLHLALPVAEAQVATMDRFVRTHDLWTTVPPSDPPMATSPAGHARPWWSNQGAVLPETARFGCEGSRPGWRGTVGRSSGCGIRDLQLQPRMSRHLARMCRSTRWRLDGFRQNQRLLS